MRLLRLSVVVAALLAIGLLVGIAAGTVLYGTLWGYGSPAVVVAITGAAILAVLGAIAAAAFRKIRLRTLGAIALVVGPTLLLFGSFWFETLSREPDLSCHNPLRSGETMIAATSNFSFTAPVDDWQRLNSRLAAFASAHDMDARFDIRGTEDSKWFYVTLCREPGTLIQLIGSPLDDTINVSVYQPQGGESWRSVDKAIRALIEREWPAGVSDEGGESSIRSTL